MKKITGILASIALILGFALQAEVAHAQAERTWVSGVGDDANPCSRTAPCKTFAGAISKTAAGGIINCLDPAGFGAVTIIKSITIDCTATFGGVLASSPGQSGIIANGAGITVILRGLSIEGSLSGGNGVNIINAAAVHIEKCKIYGFLSTGVRLATTDGGKLLISESSITNNGNAGSGAGILVRPTGVGTARVSISRSEVSNNNGAGLQSDTTAHGSAVVFLQFTDSTAAANAGPGVLALAAGFNSVFLDRSSSIHNGGPGIDVNVGGAQVLMTSTTVTGNNIGLRQQNGGQIYSYGTNHVGVNIPPDGTPVTQLGQN